MPSCSITQSLDSNAIIAFMQNMWPVITAVAVVLAFFILITRRPKPVAVVALRPNPDEVPMQRGHREFMGGLASQPALLRSFRTTRKQLDVFSPAVTPFVFAMLQALPLLYLPITAYYAIIGCVCLREGNYAPRSLTGCFICLVNMESMLFRLARPFFLGAISSVKRRRSGVDARIGRDR